jgi:hypothetical protein
MNETQERYEQAHREREGLRGGYDPAVRSLSDPIMPDSAACNARREALRGVVRDVGFDRTLIILLSVKDEEDARGRLLRDLERDQGIDEDWMRRGSP